MGFLFLLGSCGIWLDSSLWALRSLLSFNPPTLHSLLSAFVFIKFCLTTGRSDKIVYEELVALVASVVIVTMYVVICLRKDKIVIS